MKLQGCLSLTGVWCKIVHQCGKTGSVQLQGDQNKEYAAPLFCIYILEQRNLQLQTEENVEPFQTR